VDRRAARPRGVMVHPGNLPQQQEAEHYARLYKAHNPRLRFRLQQADEEGDPLDDSKPIEV
jgi:hypothetical protein